MCNSTFNSVDCGNRSDFKCRECSIYCILFPAHWKTQLSPDMCQPMIHLCVCARVSCIFVHCLPLIKCAFKLICLYLRVMWVLISFHWLCIYPCTTCMCACTCRSHAAGGGGPAEWGCPSTAAPRRPGARPTSALQRPPCCHDSRSEAATCFFFFWRRKHVLLVCCRWQTERDKVNPNIILTWVYPQMLFS